MPGHWRFVHAVHALYVDVPCGVRGYGDSGYYGCESAGFFGTLGPTDPARAEQLFEVGLSDVTAAGVTIAMNSSSMTVTREGQPASWSGMLG